MTGFASKAQDWHLERDVLHSSHHRFGALDLLLTVFSKVDGPEVTDRLDSITQPGDASRTK